MKKIFVIVAIILGCTLVTSCKEEENKQDVNVEYKVIKHQKGETKVPLRPKRIICLDYSILEILDTLKIPVMGIAKDNVPSYFENYKNDESIMNVGSVKDANFEKIHELKPDLILISTRMEGSFDELSKIAPTVYFNIDYNNFTQSLKQEWSMIGEIFNEQQKVSQLFEDFMSKASETKNKALENGKNGMVVLYNKGKFSVFGNNSRFGIIHHLFGVPLSMEMVEDARHGQTISNEFILKHNPDMLYIIDRNAIVDKKVSDKNDIENNIIKQTSAYKNNRIVYLDPEVWYLSGGGVYSVFKMVNEINQSL